jgi:hypothetical protein
MIPQYPPRQVFSFSALYEFFHIRHLFIIFIPINLVESLLLNYFSKNFAFVSIYFYLYYQLMIIFYLIDEFKESNLNFNFNQCHPMSFFYIYKAINQYQ